MLSQLFTNFDKACLKQNVFKLYTIGDCYVAMGCTDKNKRNIPMQAYNLVLLAFQMISIIQNVRTAIDFKQLDMRIGIHTVIK